ncbi:MULTISPECIES: PTS mannose/fructose/sorbose/N-acetylgalactosamine transporter subunit IIC [Helcococcus]|uniref:PTS sugar transporter subunit IIC n=1 Tax=Helcococcus bovis TaxID=3153252 RepID=A0ABW9F6K8_9FIRM
MEYNIIQILLVFLVTFIAAIDQFSFLESLYQPIVTGPVIGAILGDVQTGLTVGATFQLIQIGSMPVGGAQPPNAVIGGIMATVFAVTSKLEPTAAVAAAYPFAVLGQQAVNVVFTLMTPIMKVADKHAENANPKGISHVNYLSMAILGTIFGLIVLAFFIAGAEFGKTVADNLPEWATTGLGVAGKMMRFVGFAILLKVMLSKELWGFFFLGFAIAIVVNAIPSLQAPGLLLISLIGFAVSYWDYQIQTKVKNTQVMGGDEDGI